MDRSEIFLPFHLLASEDTKECLSRNKDYQITIYKRFLLPRSGSMLEKRKVILSLVIVCWLIGASYLAQICHELNIDFE